MTQENPEGPAEPVPPGSPGGDAEEISGVDNWVEEGGPLEPQDLADGADAAEEPHPLEQQLAERTLDLQRLQAEYVNYKRRVDRDRELVRENATFSVLSSLLPVLDDVDRAREHGELEGGFKAVADALEKAVANLGLTKYAATGETFDPNLHEALMQRPSAEVEATTVDHVAQAGYRIGERVVRAAKVTVLEPDQ